MHCFEEAVYEGRLSELIGSSVVNNVDMVIEDYGSPANPSIELLMLR